MKIRVYRSGDEVNVAYVAAVCFERFIAPHYGAQGRRSFGSYIHPEAIARRQSIDCRMFVADHEDEIVGVIEMRGDSHISMLFVSPEHQGSGIATQLFDRALRIAAKLNPGLDEVTVLAAPPAIPVYRHWGFTETGPETESEGIRYTPMRLLF